MRIEKVGGNKEEATVSCFRQLCFDEEMKMRFSRREVVFYRLIIRSKTVNVTEVNEEKIAGGVTTFWVATNLGTFLVSYPEGDSKENILN
ncbi:hypothetical protein E2C01_037496 [Portunus trituberculatus]|uniref:Uncharacterized protein n=1 Tax=Portunus trituberculatus TaxID=210409 RepID=A0A5B7FBK4_PORTR|nr:hypothetical protein [Portunus trituberculatus]